MKSVLVPGAKSLSRARRVTATDDGTSIPASITDCPIVPTLSYCSGSAAHASYCCEKRPCCPYVASISSGVASVSSLDSHNFITSSLQAKSLLSKIAKSRPPRRVNSVCVNLPVKGISIPTSCQKTEISPVTPAHSNIYLHLPEVDDMACTPAVEPSILLRPSAMPFFPKPPVVLVQNATRRSTRGVFPCVNRLEDFALPSYQSGLVFGLCSKCNMPPGSHPCRKDRPAPRPPLVIADDDIAVIDLTSGEDDNTVEECKELLESTKLMSVNLQKIVHDERSAPLTLPVSEKMSSSFFMYESNNVKTLGADLSSSLLSSVGFQGLLASLNTLHKDSSVGMTISENQVAKMDELCLDFTKLVHGSLANCPGVRVLKDKQEFDGDLIVDNYFVPRPSAMESLAAEVSSDGGKAEKGKLRFGPMLQHDINILHKINSLLTQTPMKPRGKNAAVMVNGKSIVSTNVVAINLLSQLKCHQCQSLKKLHIEDPEFLSGVKHTLSLLHGIKRKNRRSWFAHNEALRLQNLYFTDRSRCFEEVLSGDTPRVKCNISPQVLHNFFATNAAGLVDRGVTLQPPPWLL